MLHFAGLHFLSSFFPCSSLTTSRSSTSDPDAHPDVLNDVMNRSRTNRQADAACVLTRAGDHDVTRFPLPTQISFGSGASDWVASIR